MALELSGSSTTILKRQKRKRVRCSHCGETIRYKREWTFDENRKPIHLVCAAIKADPKHGGHPENASDVLKPCPVCFIIAPCLCN